MVIVRIEVLGDGVAIVHFVDLILGLAFSLRANIVRAFCHAICLQELVSIVPKSELRKRGTVVGDG
jgi:hypothetical protein